MHASQSCVYYKEYEFGHLAFLFPPTIKHFFEVFELIKRFDPHYEGLGTKPCLVDYTEADKELTEARAMVAEGIQKMQGPLGV